MSINHLYLFAYTRYALIVELLIDFSARYTAVDTISGLKRIDSSLVALYTILTNVVDLAEYNLLLNRVVLVTKALPKELKLEPGALKV